MDPTTPPPETAPATPPENPTLKRYILVDAEDPEGLVAVVEQMRRKGYDPIGGVAIFSFSAGNIRYTQAMTLPKRRVHPLVRFTRGLAKLLKEILDYDNGMSMP